MIVDAHVHVFRPAAVSPRPIDELADADRDAPVECLLADLDDCGVDAAVLVPLGPEDDYVASAVQRHPDRFAAIAVADDVVLGSAGGNTGVDRLRQRRERLPMAGLRTTWLGDPASPLRDSPLWPVLRHLAGHGMVLWSYLPMEQFGLLEELLALLPELPVVLNHLGLCASGMRVDAYRRPWFAEAPPDGALERVAALGRHPQASLMLSGLYAVSRMPPPYDDLRPTVQRLLDAFGPARTMWASDWPWIREEPGYRTIVDLPASMLDGLSASELAEIRGGTACRLLTSLQPPKDP